MAQHSRGAACGRLLAAAFENLAFQKLTWIISATTGDTRPQSREDREPLAGFALTGVCIRSLD